MKCELIKCYSREHNLNDNVVGIFHGVNVCHECYELLRIKQINENQRVINVSSSLKCIKCKAPLTKKGMHITMLCPNCLGKGSWDYKHKKIKALEN